MGDSPGARTSRNQLSEESQRIIGAATEIIEELGKRGCPDLTKSLNFSACSEFAVAGGGFCDVHSGRLHTGTKIAIKSLRVYEDAYGESNKKKILKHAARELYHWSRLRHRNVLPLMGLALFQNRISMVSGWVDNGDLRSFLVRHPSTNRFDLCVDVCAGLEYIHNDDMVHGDLKAANVLVSSNGVAMITDFGNANLKDITLQFTKTGKSGVSLRWAAPEILQDDSGPSKEADVYAYGMTALETITGKIPYAEMSDTKVTMMLAANRLTPSRPTSSIHGDLWDILESCWAQEAGHRPTINEVMGRLSTLELSENSCAGTHEVRRKPLVEEAQMAQLSNQVQAIALNPEMHDNDSEGASNLSKHDKVAAPRHELSQLREQPNRANTLNLPPGGDRHTGTRQDEDGDSGITSASREGIDWSPQFRNGPNDSYDDPFEEAIRLLSDLNGIDLEVYEDLITGLEIPPPTSGSAPISKEVLFPANLIAMILNEMWKYGLIKESQLLLANTMQTIQAHVMLFTGEGAIVPGVFWLSNVHELLSYVRRTENDVSQGTGKATHAPEFDWSEYERLVMIASHDLDCLEYNIYYSWMIETKKKLSTMIIPALIEAQSLPGFLTSERSGQLINRLLDRNPSPAFNVDDVLKLLGRVLESLKSFLLEEAVVQQVITELFKLIGVTAFNDLLMRKNFCSWKRAMQINYNIARIEEWCKARDMPEATLQLEHLLQAVKLLQLKKATESDLDIVYDVCWMLYPSQIQQLYTNYCAADYENPISPHVLQLVADRVKSADSTDCLLLTPEPLEDVMYEAPPPREIFDPEYYVPARLNVPHISRLATILSGE